MTVHPKDAAGTFDEALAGGSGNKVYVLRLYLSGMSPRSAEALTSIQAICEEYLPGQYELEVVDIYQQPAEAKNAQIVAMPTLIKQLPLPQRRMIGNLSSEERVLRGLDLPSNITTTGGR
jgi:circadian clock protein KaiB